MTKVQKVGVDKIEFESMSHSDFLVSIENNPREIPKLLSEYIIEVRFLLGVIRIK